MPAPPGPQGPHVKSGFLPEVAEVENFEKQVQTQVPVTPVPVRLSHGHGDGPSVRPSLGRPRLRVSQLAPIAGVFFGCEFVIFSEVFKFSEK